MHEYSVLDDHKLVSLLKQGDDKAFTEIYHRYWDKLFAISFNYCGQKHIAEEIAQDVFMRVWDNRAVADIQSLSAYLATAAKFSVFKYLCRVKRHEDLINETVRTQLYTSEDENINSRFLKDYINGVVEQLPEKCRLVFRYSRDMHLSVDEIAGYLKLSPRTVETHLSKALKTLRLAIKNIRFWVMQQAIGISVISFLLQC